MAPYMDSMNGPLVKAAEKALEMENIKYVLPYVSSPEEEELKDAFEKTLLVRELSGDAAELADYWFFETAVRLHRKDEDKSYTGLKSADPDWGPILPKINRAIDTENVDELLKFLLNFIKEDISSRFEELLSKKDYDPNDVEEAREYINARTEFIRYSIKFYNYVEKG
ncbi:MAG: DUF6448 family protein [Methanobacterium sp.]|jgi:hypothetical protein|nr:DUF6448 family protein [Methanobacterium sp.]